MFNSLELSRAVPELHLTCLVVTTAFRLGFKFQYPVKTFTCLCNVSKSHPLITSSPTRQVTANNLIYKIWTKQWVICVLASFCWFTQMDKTICTRCKRQERGNSLYLTPWVGLYSPPTFSAVSERKLARTVFPLWKTLTEHYKREEQSIIILDVCREKGQWLVLLQLTLDCETAQHLIEKQHTILLKCRSFLQVPKQWGGKVSLSVIIIKLNL